MEECGDARIARAIARANKKRKAAAKIKKAKIKARKLARAFDKKEQEYALKHPAVIKFLNTTQERSDSDTDGNIDLLSDDEEGTHNIDNDMQPYRWDALRTKYKQLKAHAKLICHGFTPTKL